MSTGTNVLDNAMSTFRESALLTLDSPIRLFSASLYKVSFPKLVPVHGVKVNDCFFFFTVNVLPKAIKALFSPREST